MRKLCVRLTVALFVLFVPAIALAQGSIAGMVRDTSGAIMPGVTVEASSDSLIEKSRTAITDGAGQYKIVDLPPGTYSMAYTLTGFKTVRRGGIVIEGTFVAQINVELQVGAMEETLTVTAETPTVDVINTQKEFVANRDVLDAIPTTRRDTTARALLIPGTTVTPFVLGQYNLTSHGSSTSDFTMAIDGLRVNNLCGSGQYSGFYMNDARHPGVELRDRIRIRRNPEQRHPRQPGAERRRQPFLGILLPVVPGQRPAVGQPHRSDEGDSGERAPAHRHRRHGVRLAGQSGVRRPDREGQGLVLLHLQVPGCKIYVPSAKFPDGSQAYRNLMGNYSGAGRVTVALGSKDKVRAYIEKQYNGEFYNGFNTYAVMTPEASTDAFGVGWIPQVRWTRAHSNKLLLEAGIAQYNQAYEQNCSRTRPTRWRCPSSMSRRACSRAAAAT